jgi:hypothetical protein
MGTTWEVAAFAVAAAMAFALASSLKHISASVVPAESSLRPGALARFTRATLTHPLWQLGIVCDVVGLTLQLVALHLGSLVLVQPLLVSGMVFALLLRQRLAGSRLRPSEFGWAGLLTAALAGFLVLTALRSSRVTVAGVDRTPALIAGLAGVVVAVVCVHLGRRPAGPARQAALIGVAVGILYTAVAALLKTLTDIAVASPLHLLQSWQLYTVLALGGAGLVLNQLAFQAGPLSASLPATTTVDPLLSIVVGIAVFDESVSVGPATVIAGAALLGAIGLAVIKLARASAPPGGAARRPVTLAT